MKCWLATIRHFTDDGIKVIEKAVEELLELDDIIQQGAALSTIHSIEITKLRGRENRIKLEPATEHGQLTPADPLALRPYTLENLD